MALTQTRLVGPQTLTNAAAVVYTTGAGNTVIVKQIALTNLTGSSASVTLWVVPSGQTRADSHKFLAAVDVFANETTLINTNIVLNASDTIDAQASAPSTFNLMINGIVES